MHMFQKIYLLVHLHTLHLLTYVLILIYISLELVFFSYFQINGIKNKLKLYSERKNSVLSYDYFDTVNLVLPYPDSNIIHYTKEFKDNFKTKDIFGKGFGLFDDGIDNNLEAGEAEERNIYEAIDAGKDVKKLPMSLGEALDELRNDEVIKSSMPDEMFRVFEHYKRDEWERFMHTTTEWDMENYLDCLP